MTRHSLRLAVSKWLREGKILKLVKARQLQELYKNMCRRPEKWGLPPRFGHEPNTDWKTLWMELNLQRFDLPWDPRTMEPRWGDLPEKWLVGLLVENRLKPVDIAYKVDSIIRLKPKEAHEWLCFTSERIGASGRNIEQSRWLLYGEEDYSTARKRGHSSKERTTGLTKYNRKRRKYIKQTLGAVNSARVAYLVSDFIPPHTWLLKHLTKLDHVPRNVHSRLVIEWIVKKLNTEAFGKPIHIFNGREQIYLKTVLDEIYEQDLVQGVKTAVDHVKAAIKERRGGDYAEKLIAEKLIAEKLIRLNITYRDYPSDWPPLPPEIEQITTSPRLAQEGMDLEHCVMSYHDKIAAGNSFIFAINVNGRSTFELDRYGRMTQHQTNHHRTPTPENAAVMNSWLRKFKIINV